MSAKYSTVTRGWRARQENAPWRSQADNALICQLLSEGGTERRRIVLEPELIVRESSRA